MLRLLMAVLLLLTVWMSQPWAQTPRGPGSLSGATANPNPRPRDPPAPNSGGGGGNGVRQPGPVTSPAPPQVQPDDVETGQVMILSKDPATLQQILNTLAGEQIRPVATATLQTLGWSLALFQFADLATASQQLVLWQQRYPRVIVDYNYLYRAQADVAGREYALGMLGLPDNSAKNTAPGTTSATDQAALRTTRVGMLDTAVTQTDWMRDLTLTSKPFLAGGPAGQTELPANPAHGTAIASLIARVAPTIRLFAAAVMAARGDQTLTTSYRLLQGVDWLLAKRVQVINMSLSGRYDKNLATTIAELMQRGVLVTAAAGNQGSSAPPAYPAAYATTYKSMLAVTAVDVEGQLYSQANHGAYISVAAPGVNIWVPAASGKFPPENVAARYVSGTSYASAYAAGAMAHWLAMNKRKVGITAPQRFCQTAKDLGPAGRDDGFGCGLLQINAALRF